MYVTVGINIMGILGGLVSMIIMLILVGMSINVVKLSNLCILHRQMGEITPKLIINITNNKIDNINNNNINNIDNNNRRNRG